MIRIFADYFTRWPWLRLILDFLFRFGLPIAAHLPPKAARWLARRFGRLCARLDLDWRTLGLRKHYVAEQTRRCYQEISPGLGEHELQALVVQRFEYSVNEELEGHWLGMRQAGSFQCGFTGLDEIRKQMGQGRGIVLLTMHFDATLMGVAHLGLAGLKISLMTSDIVEDPRVLPSVQRYFRRKYSGIESVLNGGHSWHVETHLKSFYRALGAGEGVVILGDAHALSPEQGVVLEFLGRKRAIAAGAIRMAEKMGSPIAAFVCLRDNNSYQVVFSPVFWPENGRHEGNAQQIYTFLGSHISGHPGRWWAADLLPGFISVD